MATFVFDPLELRDLALRHVGKPVPDIAADLEQDLADKYGDLISRDAPWVITPAGFLMYQVKMVFAKPNEYLGLMGIPVESTGHTGRHPVTYYDTMLSGGSRNFHAGEHDPQIVSAGDFLVTRPGEAFAAQVTDHIFFLEYCRGPLVTLMPFGFSNYFFATLDFQSVYRLAKTWLKLVWRSRSVKGAHPAIPASHWDQ